MWIRLYSKSKTRYSKYLYAIFPEQPVAELTDVLKREHKAAEKCHVCLKEC